MVCMTVCCCLLNNSASKINCFVNFTRIIKFSVVSIKLAEEWYSVNEDAGSVTICVEKIGQTAIDISISIRARESSPRSATGE